MKSFELSYINEFLEGKIVGDTSHSITNPAHLLTGKEGEIVFIGHKKYEKDWALSNASVGIVSETIGTEPGENRAFIVVANPELAMNKVLSLFAPAPPEFETQIHPSAVVHPSVKLGENVKIGAGCFIGKDVTIGDDTIIYPNVTILDASTVGKSTILWPGCVVRERCHIGSHTILHPNCTIGADGFGFTPCPKQGLIKVTHIGNVVIGNWVEIGANSCVDRAKFNSTMIGDGCKIDNLVQIGHNSVMGRFCIMAGNSGLSGSVTLGDGVIIGGSASIKDHVTIGAGAIVGAGSGVTADIPAGKTMLGYPAVEARDALKQWAILKRLVKNG
jgi:UDP-3-O-[3-hydroxymyristoyl] glucosamine N-acyltransferase